MAVQPTTPKGIRTRKSILEAAARVFSRLGYVDARVSDVVNESDLSMGAVYRYFDNKEDIFAGVIADLHEELFAASRAETPFDIDPHRALYEANLGYLSLYHENRHLMRAFIESTAVEEQFLHIWWEMRERHVHRFVAVANRAGVHDVVGMDLTMATQAMASLVEQAAFAWFAHESLLDEPVDLDTAARIITRCWYLTIMPHSTPVEADPRSGLPIGEPPVAAPAPGHTA